MIAAVIDSSALFDVLFHGGLVGLRAHEELGDCQLHAPELLAPELVNVMRRLVRQDPALKPLADRLVREYDQVPIARFPHDDLLSTAWQLRDTVSAYDAMYVALAIELDIPLLTRDRRLVKAAAKHCDVRLLA